MARQILDPLAQSFFVEKPTFITKADLFFYQKDTSLPVVVKIRRNQNGIPSQLVMPFSEKVIDAVNVVVSSNANVATTVTFDSPVFLDIGEYSLTVGSDSKNYRVWISGLDEVDVTTEKRITEQPVIGSLFKSQNSSTWTPTQLEDLKFKLYRAKFNTNVVSTVMFNVEDTFSTDTLVKDPLEFYPNSKVVKLYHFNHGMTSNAWIKINNLANANIQTNTTIVVPNIFGNLGNTIENNFFQISNVKLDSYTIILNNPSTVTSSTRYGGSGVTVTKDIAYGAVTPTIGMIVPSNTTATHKILTTTPVDGESSNYVKDSEYTVVTNKEEYNFSTAKVLTGPVNSFKKLSNIDPITYRIELTTNNDRVSPYIDTSKLGLILKNYIVNYPSYSNSLSHENVVIADNNEANVFSIFGSSGIISLVDTSDRANARSMINGSYIYLTAGANANNANDGAYRVVSVSDNGTLANVKVEKVSGNVVTDLAGNAFGTIRIENTLGYIAEEAASSGSAYSKYITRQVDFVNQSTALQLIVDVLKPPGTDVKFYYRSKLSNESTALGSLEYKEITGVTIPTSFNGNFNEVSKLVENLPAFNSIVVKVVFLSNNSGLVPKIKNFRLLALE